MLINRSLFHFRFFWRWWWVWSLVCWLGLFGSGTSTDATPFADAAGELLASLMSLDDVWIVLKI